MVAGLGMVILTSSGRLLIAFALLVVVVVPLVLWEARKHRYRAEAERAALRAQVDQMSPDERLEALRLYERRFGTLLRSSQRLREDIEQLNRRDSEGPVT